MKKPESGTKDVEAKDVEGAPDVSASPAVAPPLRVSASDHNRVADLVREGNGKHVRTLGAGPSGARGSDLTPRSR